MKKKFLKFLVAGSFAFIFGYGIYAYGCADGWWGSGYTSLFSPEITVNNKDYEPFFYDDYNFFYNGNNIRSTTSLFKEETIDEWAGYLEKYDKEVVAYFLYDTKINEILTEIASEEDKITAFNSYVSKGKALHLNDTKSQNLLTFLFLSRGIEVFSNQTYNYWDYENRLQVMAGAQEIEKIEQAFNKASKKDVFYKNRLWFQVLRAKFYSEDRSSVIPFFLETAKQQPENNLYYRGLSYLGGAYKSVGNFEKANTAFAEVFNKCKPLMASALYDYRPLESTLFENSLKQAESSETKEVMYALQGYYTNEFAMMQTLYQLNPTSPHIDFLLSRWININERDLHTFTDYESLDVDPKKVKKEFKNKINENQLKWISEIAKESKVHNPYIWKAASAYFNALVGNHSKASEFLKQAHGLSKNQEQKEQVRSLRLLNHLLRIEAVDLQAEGMLIEDASWLFYDAIHTNRHYDTSTHRIGYLQEFTKKYLAALYKNEKNALMSELVYPMRGFYKNRTQSDAIEKLLLSKERTAWQDLFVGIYPYKLEDIYESRGIYLFYQDEIEKALAEFEKITPFEKSVYNWNKQTYEIQIIDYKIQELPGNPFNGKIKDCNDCDHAAKQRVKYSQLDFLKKVKEMQDKIKEGEDVFHNALLVGNAFYNASYFGNARKFYYNHIINEYGNSISKEHERMLYGMENVKKYYTMAQKAAKTDEQRAQMAYMLAKVERNDFYSNTYFIPNDYFYPYGSFVSFKKWKGFEELKNKYSETKYYQEVINECGYFRKYLKI